jgi:hypothetical protein
MKKVETWLPVFQGFYGTHLEPDETPEIDDINQIRESKSLESVTYDECSWDYPEYYNRVALKACEYVENELKDFISAINFQSVVSPKYYNYENDQVNIEVEMTDENFSKVKEYLYEHSEEFSAYLKERYTSRSGFISFHSNDVAEWLKNASKWMLDSHKLGSMLDFIMFNENDDPAMDMTNYCAEEMYVNATNYEELTETV